MTVADDPRNIVMLTADSLRADHCGFVDSASSLTPTIDRLAEEGVSYSEAVAPGPRTPSSVPVFFTGEFMTDDPEWSMADWQGRQSRIGRHMEQFTHLSERLQRRGYETATFTTNPWTTRESSFHHGFDDFNEVSADSPDVDSKHLSDSTLFTVADGGLKSLPGDPGGWSSKKEWFSQWTGYFELIEDRIESLSEPFFLWVFVLDSHQPYITPRAYREESAAWEMYYSILRYWYGETNDAELPDRAGELIGQAYRDAVRSVDGFVDALTGAVDAYDPVTVFFSDHGEALGEHGNFGHEQTLYEENLRVPLFVHNAGATGTVDEQLPLRSLPELLCDLADVTPFDPAAHTRQFVVSHTENNATQSVRTSRWKLVDDGETARLFDLQGDPDETTDVSESYPEVAASLADVLASHDATQTEKARVGDAAAEVVSGEADL
ncbi:arylsulfatase [Halorubrum kocurii JCM 14978]|uniref:Arylsulfatase n=1 Tax=Halorubrum kocurii JCM 14978 TaxID=1230456 RepID=M0PJ18_9EURY|nr:arylsulfatase [Halorubrum kocurii JCM 14978]